MTMGQLGAVVIILAGFLLPSESAAQGPHRASDGVVIDHDGVPQYHSVSLCAVDPATGQAGAAVTTRHVFVGRVVPHVRARVGAVCTQGDTVVQYGPRGLDLLEKGIEPHAIVERLLAEDAGRETRQLGVIDMKGRSAAHTGNKAYDWKGSRKGRNYTVQGNMNVGPEVTEAVAAHFESTEATGMPLAERMILAIEAGHLKGGDRRWGRLQSAAIKIADPEDPGRGDDYIALAIEVGEHPEPVAEMKRIYYTTARRLGYRNFSRIDGPDVIELKRMLHGLGFWRPTLAAFPDAPSISIRKMRELRTTDPALREKLVAEYSRLTTDYVRDFSHYDAEAMEAVDKFRKAHGLDYLGNPFVGLVDERLVDALRAEYLKKKRGAGEQPSSPVLTNSRRSRAPAGARRGDLPRVRVRR